MSKIQSKFLENQFVESETPAGLINGVNTAYTLAFTPVYSSTVSVFLNGLLQTQGVDYTISGANITMTVAPALAQILKANYIKG